MIKISYTAMAAAISILWILVRVLVFTKRKHVSLKRELHLLLVYVCLIVVVRFTFFPFSKVNGWIQPLVFDIDRCFPFRVNLCPFVFLFDYPTRQEALLNLIGNIAMFIPLGIVWPSVYKGLDRHWKVIAAGFGFSLVIEILQLPFFDRVSDIDDLILNTTGFLIGYGIYLFIRFLRRKQHKNIRM